MANRSTPEPTQRPESATRAGGQSANEVESGSRRTVRKRRTKQAAEMQPGGVARAEVSPEERHAMIAEVAYLRAERRGFMPGHELEDWCAAEREIDALLGAQSQAPAQ